MSSPHTTDVLVVGLGPAGASAAAVAARCRLRVLAVDRKRAPGRPVQCAELVPPLSGASAGVLQESRRQDITSMLTIVEQAAPVVSPGFQGIMLDRQAFDAALVEEARSAGADCRLDCGLERLETDGTAILSDGTCASAPVIIGADGPRSLVGRAIGSVNEALIETRQVTVPLLRPHTATDIYLSANYPGGYAWLFPKGEVANLGIGLAPFARRQLKPELESLRAMLIAGGRIGREALSTTGGAIPVGGLVRPWGSLGTNLVLLAGDAAGLANPVTGAGICAAVQSGQMAGTCAAEALSERQQAIKAYVEELEDVFGPALSRALVRRTELLSRYRTQLGPRPADLARGWIAFPEYWAA
ncbi:MAG: NAD(P)/FAD-dependent oxidoreductase [Hyphomicrobiaceae bacterium]